jgi:hypothetical protein
LTGLALFICLVIGFAFGAAMMFYFARDRVNQAIRQRREATKLMQRINGDPMYEPEEAKTEAKRQQLPSEIPCAPQHILNMADPFRAKLAVERAQAKLPPNDDLRGMSSPFVLKVEQARMRNAR